MKEYCPRIEYNNTMDPKEGGRTLFECDENKCTPYKIEINPEHLELFEKKIRDYLKDIGITGKYLEELTNYLTREYGRYVISHELVHWKFIEENPEAIPRLIKKYGRAWRLILEGINDKQTVRGNDLWKKFTPYDGEQRLVEELAKKDREIEKYLMKYYDVSSCVPN